MKIKKDRWQAVSGGSPESICMTEIILSQVGQTITADSRDVAENFGKEHKNVMQSIQNLVAENSAAKSLFIESEYENRGKFYPCYLMNRDGFSLLVMGFTGKESLAWKLKYIDAFNKMESAIRENGIPKNFAEALRLAADQQEKIEAARKALDAAQPAILFTKSVQTSDTSILIRDLAKLICQNGHEIGEKRLYAWLRDSGYLTKSGSGMNAPTQRYVEQGLFEVKERTIGNPDGSVLITRTTMVTGKGQVYFINKFFGGKEK